MRRAFTLLEVVFVLIILGILASIGSEIVAKVYENYLLSRSVSTTSYKLDVALLQISRRLAQRIKDSEIVRDNSDTINTLSISASTNYSHLEWIGRAYEARRGKWDGTKNQPGWSGLADLDNSDKTKLVTPGSNLTYAKEIVSGLYGLDLDAADNGCAVVFYDTYQETPIQAYGWDGSTPNAVYGVHRSDDTTFAFDETDEKNASDIYDLVCSAYALKHTSNDQLVLYYNYRPWDGESYTDGNSQVLIDNVTTFKVRKRDRAIEIRLCTEDNTTGTAVEFCGKKVIF